MVTDFPALSRIAWRALARLILSAVILPVLIAPATAAGFLKVGVQLEPPNLDPTSGAAAAIDEVVYANIFEGLTRINEDGSISPLLSTSWTVNENATEYIFDLRRGVAFHDGASFTARDVKFSLDRARAENSANAQRAIFSLIDTVDILDSFKIRITLKEPLGGLPTYLGWGDAVIVSETSAEKNATQPIGTGPFRFQSWRRGSTARLVRNDEYWGHRPRLDGIDFFFIPDPTAAYAALMAGDVDGFPNYPAPENLPLIARDDRFKILTGASEGEILLAINNGKPPFDDIRVRRALNYAINKSAIIKGALDGRGVAIGSHFPPHHPAYIDLSNRYPFNPDKARALFADAGYPEGFDVTLILPPPAYARRSGEIISAQLAAAGVRVTLRNMEWAQWLDQVFGDKSYDLTIVSHTEPLDIDIYARDDYYFQYHNEKFNDVIAGLRAASDEKQRIELFHKAQKIIADDAVNVFIASAPKTGVWQKEVKGVWRNGPIQANDFTNADFEGRIAVSHTNAPPKRFPAFSYVLFVCIMLTLALVWRANASISYIASRIAIMAATLFAASVIIFAMLEAAPGDPAIFMMGINADPAAIAALRAELHLDQPIHIRYFEWLWSAVSGDFGVSYTYQTPVSELISERLWVSLPLALLALLISTAIGIPAGIYAATHKDSWIDYWIRGGAQVGIAIPNFWLAILLVIIFAILLGWFSAGGFPGWSDSPLKALKALLLPAIALALPQAAIMTQIMRTSLITVLDRDFIRTARAKGLSYRQATYRHGVRNAIIPVLTILGLQFSFLVAGAVIIENVFYLPGLGRLVFQAIAQRDLIVVKGVTLILVFIVVFAAFIVDLAYSLADPRLQKHGGEK